MLRGGREVVVGFAADPTYGPLLMFGLGGIYQVLRTCRSLVRSATSARAR